VKWLINRVEELEEERDEWKDTAQYYYMTNQELREQSKRYRKAINYIIKKVMLFGTNEEVYEAIQDAIKAFEGEK
jgi:transposase-like protein